MTNRVRIHFVREVRLEGGAMRALVPCITTPARRRMLLGRARLLALVRSAGAVTCPRCLKAMGD